MRFSLCQNASVHIHGITGKAFTTTLTGSRARVMTRKLAPEPRSHIVSQPIKVGVAIRYLRRLSRTHQLPFHKLRERTPNPSLPWHQAHLFIALLSRAASLHYRRPLVAFQSSRQISLRRSEQRFHMFRAELIPPLGHDENPFALRVALLWGRGLGNPHGLVCETLAGMPSARVTPSTPTPYVRCT